MNQKNLLVWNSNVYFMWTFIKQNSAFAKKNANRTNSDDKVVSWDKGYLKKEQFDSLAILILFFNLKKFNNGKQVLQVIKL